VNPRWKYPRGFLIGAKTMRSVDHSFYNSAKWRQVAADYKKSVHGLCERCKKKGLYVPAKIVHHKIHLNESNVNNPSVTYNFDNLEALCLGCHNAIHMSNGKRYTFDKATGEMFIKSDL